MEVAEHYLERRGIPRRNFLVLSAPLEETCSREAYEENIAAPTRERLRAPGGTDIRAVVLCYGMPLRVSGPAATPEESKPVDRQLRRSDQVAAVDSELALVRLVGYPLGGWLPNPAYPGNEGKVLGLGEEGVLVVARLDGPTPEIARKLVDDALAAEARGLTGGVYLDARWVAPPADQEVADYAWYDRSLHRAGEVLRRRGWAVTVDQGPELFPPGSKLPTALYCGWYRLAHYVDAFAWQQGAVGYHIASSEAATLRVAESQVWCKRMLEEGVAATLGPVDEPYVQAFPPPEQFFELLSRGVLTLGESYLRSLPHLSWKMVLIGDPLYKPFRRVGE
jgi:uncharacterized protein (TIGR03790 family)